MKTQVKLTLIQRLFKKENIAQSAGILLIFTILQRIIQTGRGIVFARLLGPVNYGIYTLALFFIPLAVTFAKLGIPSCFSRYIIQYERKGTLRNFFKRNYLIITVGGIFITLICFLNAQNLSSIIYGSSVYHGLIIICALTILPYVILESLEASFAGLRVFKLASVLRFTQFFIFTALGIVLVILYPKAESVLWANLISFIITVFFFGFIFQKYLMDLNSQSLKIEEDNYYRKIFKFSVWFIISPVIYTLFRYTDRWMLGHFTDLSYVGIYSVASNISGLIFMFGMIMGNVLMPNLSKIWEQGNKDNVMYMLNFALKINTLVLLAFGIILLLFKKQIISILYGVEYVNCLPVIGILLIFWLFNSIYWTIGGYAQLIEKNYISFLCSSIGLISNIFLNYILIPKHGLMGAAIATTTSFAVILISTYFWFRKEGLKVKSSTIFVCILPIMFLLNNILIGFFFLILIGIIFGTNFIVSKDEKNLVYEKIRKTIGRLK